MWSLHPNYYFPEADHAPALTLLARVIPSITFRGKQDILFFQDICFNQEFEMKKIL